MKLQQIFEAANTSVALSKVVSYIEKKLGVTLLKIPGVEHFHNSTGNGYGIRYVYKGGTRCIRFNWNSEGPVGNLTGLHSVDIFNGTTHDPNFTVETKGISIAQSLPMLVSILRSPSIGNQFVFPVDPVLAMSDSSSEESVTEAHRGDFTSEEALSDFLKKLAQGKSYTRSDFIGQYHIIHAGIFDTVMNDFKDKFNIDGRRVTLSNNANLTSLKDSILSKAGVIEVTKAGSKEVYFKSKAEEKIEADAGEDRIPYADTLEHLESLVHALIKGSYNALFVAGKGGSVSGSTPINIIIDNPNNISNDNDKTEDTSSNSI